MKNTDHKIILLGENLSTKSEDSGSNDRKRNGPRTEQAAKPQGGRGAGGGGLSREGRSDSVPVGRRERRRHACVDPCAARAPPAGRA